MGRTSIGLVIVGVILLFGGINRMRTARLTRDTPQRLTCAEFAAKGPGANHHVALTECRLGSNVAVQMNSERRGGTSYDVFIPAYPAGEASGASDSDPLRVLVRASRLDDPGRAGALVSQASFQGIIANQALPLSDAERQLLSRKFSGINLDSVWILWSGMKRTTPTAAIGMSAGGVAMVAVGLFVAWSAFRPKPEASRGGSAGGPRDRAPGGAKLERRTARPDDPASTRRPRA